MLDEYADVIAQIESAEESIANDEKFRKKLGIGADAYRLLKASSLGAAGVGGFVAGAAVASSPVVASAFFGGTAATVAGWLGLGLAATTPVGWVVAAGVAGFVAVGGAVGGATVAYGNVRKKLFEEVPKQTNAPLDVLAASVIAFLMPVAFRLALADGNVDDRERQEIRDYFVNEWGYSESYADRKIDEFQNEPDLVSLDELFAALEELKNHDKDCNFDHIFLELLKFLEELANADGEFHHGEKATIGEIKELLRVHGLLPS